jgi:hypothetical protein
MFPSFFVITKTIHTGIYEEDLRGMEEITLQLGRLSVAVQLTLPAWGPKVRRVGG